MAGLASVLVGSHAMNARIPGYRKKPVDIDLIATFDQLPKIKRDMQDFYQAQVISIPYSQNKTILRCVSQITHLETGMTHLESGRGYLLAPTNIIVEVELAWPGTAAEQLVEAVHIGRPEWWSLGNQFLDSIVPSLDELYTIKMSHRYLKNSPHFLKTRNDIMAMRILGARVFDQEWLKLREKETYTYNHPKLDVKKDDFFKGDGINYVYDHDDIHKVCAHLAEPAYTYYMKDNSPVMCDKRKFFYLPEIERLYGVLEEAQVLALERSQIPFKGTVDPKRSFDMALFKVCTSITSGWFREYAWENYDKVQELYESNYADKFWSAVDNNQVRLFTGSRY